MGKKNQEEIGTGQIGSLYITTLRDGCDLHKTAAFEATQHNNRIGPEIWRFSSLLGKIKVWLYIAYFSWKFRNFFRLNPFYKFEPFTSPQDNGVAKGYCQRRKKY